MEGFNPDDFEFLDKADRDQLSDHVEKFRAVAKTVPPTAPARADQVDSALPHFLRIVELLQFDRYGDAEAFRVGKQIEREIGPNRPEWLRDLRFDTGVDASGDPALWIWAVISDEAATATPPTKNVELLRSLLSDASRSVAPTLWPYVRVRTESDQEVVHAEASA